MYRHSSAGFVYQRLAGSAGRAQVALALGALLLGAAPRAALAQDAPAGEASPEAEGPAASPSADPSEEGWGPGPQVGDETEEGMYLSKPPATVAEEDRPTARPFIKGELTRVGASKLVAANNRLGVRMGYEYLDVTHYGLLIPEFDLKIGDLRVGLGVPLRLEIFGPEGFANAGALRAEDYDQPSELAKVIRYLSYGRKEDFFFLQISQLDAATIGHGPLMRRYFANADVDARRVGVQLDAYNDYGGFELHLNDVIAPFVLGAGAPEGAHLGAVIGGLVFVKPVSWFSDTVLAKSVSLGFSWAGEVNAPLRLAPPDTIGRIVTDAQHVPVYEGGLVDLMGVDFELKVVKTDAVDIKPFVDFSVLREPFSAGRGGWGATLGALGRFNFVGSAAPDATVHALRAIAELRVHAGNYLPGYFDTFYETQKYAYALAEDGRWRTKYEALQARDPEAIEVGGYFELSYAPVGALALGAALELSTAPGGNNLYLHAELPVLSWIQLFATVHKRGFTWDQLDLGAPDTIFVSGGRLQLLPILWVNAEAYQVFNFDDAPTRKVFDRTFGVNLDVELGWEFY